MGSRSSHVSYPREDIVQVLRTLEELVVSLDQIGSACSQMDSAERNAMLWAFIQDHGIFQKAATARRIMSVPFPDSPGADGMDDLERAMKDVPYWAPTKRRMQGGGGDV